MEYGLQSRVKSEEWTPEEPVNNLPKWLQKLFISEAGYLHEELKSKRLEVVLTEDEPSRQKLEGRKKREAVNHNPGWYRELYKRENTGVRKYSNFHFERDRCFSALERIINLKDKEPFNYTGKRKVVAKRALKKEYSFEERTITKYKYDTILRQLIFERLTEGYKEDDFEVPPNQKVRQFFGIDEEKRNKLLDEEYCF